MATAALSNRDILVSVFSFFSHAHAIRELGHVGSVCKIWNVVSRENVLWRPILKTLDPAKDERLHERTRSYEISIRSAAKAVFKRDKETLALILSSIQDDATLAHILNLTIEGMHAMPACEQMLVIWGALRENATPFYTHLA